MKLKEIYIRSTSQVHDSDSTFITTLEVIQKVMNVPMCALTSLLRANGYNSEDDTTGFCIDEKKLEIFSDAYIRKMRSYFFSSLRNISILSPKELNNFNEFIKFFKKKGTLKGSCKWSDIDTNHLREVFKKQVEEKTPQKKSSLHLSEEFAKGMLSFAEITIIRRKEKGNNLSGNITESSETKLASTYFSSKDNENILCKNAKKRLCNLYKSHADAILKAVTRRCKSFYKNEIQTLNAIAQGGYGFKSHKIKKHIVPLVSKIILIFTSARYYIYPNDSDNDPNNTILHFVI